MTIQNNHSESRDEVLFAFHEAYERPSADQIIEWTRRYPQFADDIRTHAAIARDWAARKSAPAAVPDQSMLARGYSRVLNALYNARTAAAAKASVESQQSFQQLMAACGTNVPQLARELDIPRSVLADLFNGGMLAPAGRRLIDLLTRAFNITVESFHTAHSTSLHAPRLGNARADGAPTIIPRSYEEIIRASGMSPERIRYWLSDD